MTNTPWEQMVLSGETAAYLRSTHKLWSRLFDGEHVFTVLPNGQKPGNDDGGYYTIAAALKAKGMMT
jgi:hypothetical protein